jgi:FtsZ-binding cell division protein ZapB
LTRNENEILIKSQRKKKTFAQLFKNKVFDKLEDEIFANCELLFICDQKREKVVKNIIENKIKENILYSNANISLNVIASLNQGIYKMNVQNKRLEKDINLLKNDIEKLKEKVNVLSSNKRNTEENLERLSIILDKMRISKVYVDLNLEDILANKIQSCKDRIGAMAIAFDECSTEYFKISNEAGIFIGNVINFIIEDDKRKQLKEFLDSFENEINKAHFKKYFIAIKEMIFGKKFTESPQKLSFIISLDNMDVVQKFLSYVYFLESKSSNEFIELKFSIALLNIGIQLYGNKLNSLIKESSKDISLVNENIIRYVNKNNIF